MGRIKGVDHMQLAMPVGGEALAREFYAGALGLTEIPKPAVLAVRGGVWFECGTLQLHLGADPDFQAARKAHPALLVEEFAAFTEQLQQRGLSVTPDETVNGRLRANLADPFGNRIELIEA